MRARDEKDFWAENKEKRSKFRRALAILLNVDLQSKTPRKCVVHPLLAFGQNAFMLVRGFIQSIEAEMEKRKK